MLARLPLGWLLLMAAVATALLCHAARRWMRLRGRTVTRIALVCAGCCAGMAAVGTGRQEWNTGQMLVLYSFTCAGFTVGVFPGRKLLSGYADEWHRGIRRRRYEYPVRYQMVLYCAVIVSELVAFVLAT